MGSCTQLDSTLSSRATTYDGYIVDADEHLSICQFAQLDFFAPKGLVGDWTPFGSFGQDETVVLFDCDWHGE